MDIKKKKKGLVRANLSFELREYIKLSAKIQIQIISIRNGKFARPLSNGKMSLGNTLKIFEIWKRLKSDGLTGTNHLLDDLTKKSNWKSLNTRRVANWLRLEFVFKSRWLIAFSVKKFNQKETKGETKDRGRKRREVTTRGAHVEKR